MRFTSSRLNYILMSGDWWSVIDRSCPVASDSCISPVFSLSKSNDRWLDGRCPVIGRLEVSVSPTWLVVSECPVTGHARWLVTGHARSVRYVFLSIGQVAGGWLADRRMPSDRWSVDVLPWEQVPKELPPIWVLPQAAGP